VPFQAPQMRGFFAFYKSEKPLNFSALRIHLPVMKRLVSPALRLIQVILIVSVLVLLFCFYGENEMYVRGIQGFSALLIIFSAINSYRKKRKGSA
jgi:hypothetical protein